MNIPHQKLVSVNIPIWKLYAEPLATLQDVMLSYGDLVKINTPWPIYLINDAEISYHVLKKTNYLFDKKLFNYKMLSRIIGQGIVCNQAKSWERSRSTIKPYFTEKHLPQWQASIDAALEDTIAKWRQKETRGEQVDVSNDMAQLAFATTISYVFGVPLSGRYERLCGELEELDFSAIEGLLLPFDLVPTRMNRNIRRLHTEIKKLIKELSSESKALGRHSLAEALRQQLNEEQAAQELITLIFAGYATVSSLLTWCLYLLALNQSAAEPLFKETRSAAEGIGIHELESLKYTIAFIKETMRLYPPVWLLPRRCSVSHEHQGFKFRENMPIWILPWTLHRNPRYWDDAEQFIPERFLSDAKVPAKAYIPFSIGPRMCIGKSFGFKETLYVVAKLTSQFRFSIPQDHKVELTSMIAVKPKRDLRLSIETNKTDVSTTQRDSHIQQIL
ncbi:MAG: hypothetical protein AMJ53_07170 [Gammaproteobacteria bacterium SG8_11]|nr:MAG: hypothetical protein AMJ53_07170 [Gammaproteobacteria bacterium SG8_11]